MAEEPLGEAARERLESQRIERRYGLGRLAIKGGSWVGGVWIASEALGNFAGKDTSIKGVLSLFAELNVAIGIVLTGGAVVWAVLERWLRQRKVEQLQARIRELETDLDPRRSSSKLTQRGQTNPTDRR